VVPTALVREAARARGIVSLAALVTLAACSGSSLSEPRDANLVSKRDGVATDASGLEQRLTTRVEAAPATSPYTAQLVVTSVIVNTGAAPVKLTWRTCLFRDSDVETTAKVDRFEPFIACSAIEATTVLAAGQSTPPMEVTFGVRSPAGNYTLTLRHALSPEFRAETSFRVP